jgi:tRNA (guanine-N7-)-methyltransferase
MARTKFKRLVKVKELPNVFSKQNQDVTEALKNFSRFKNIFTIEIGCGQGDYTIELAQNFPERIFIGIDVKGARIFNGATKALNLRLKNVAFVLARAEKLLEIFNANSVEEINIPFPDPHIRRSNQNRRLISPFFLKIYDELLIDSGLIHFKTDNQGLYEYASKTISDFGCKIHYETNNLYGSSNDNFNSNIKTIYETHYIKEGRIIKYICFRF